MARHIGKRLGYARVSSTDQNLDRQRAALGEVDRLFQEKQSGAGRGRAGGAGFVAALPAHPL